MTPLNLESLHIATYLNFRINQRYFVFSHRKCDLKQIDNIPTTIMLSCKINEPMHASIFFFPKVYST